VFEAINITNNEKVVVKILKVRTTPPDSVVNENDDASTNMKAFGARLFSDINVAYWCIRCKRIHV